MSAGAQRPIKNSMKIALLLVPGPSIIIEQKNLVVVHDD